MLIVSSYVDYACNYDADDDGGNDDDDGMCHIDRRETARVCRICQRM